MIHSFADFELDTGLFELRKRGKRIPLEPQVFDVLAYLVKHRERVVTKAELLDEIWPEHFVTEGALSSRLMAARKALGDSGRSQKFIETSYRRGFRFIADVTECEPAPAGDSAQAVANSASSRGAHRDAPPGRGTELARILGWLDEVSYGKRRVVLVTGEAGLGKTRLVEAFLGRVSSQDLWIARANCVEQRGAYEAYMPVLAALEGLARRDREVIAVLARNAPTWLLQMPWLLEAGELPELERLAVGTTRERMLREMDAAVYALTERRPLVLVLEDLHWCDQSSLDLLLRIAHGIEPVRLLLVGTFRPADAAAVGHPMFSVQQEVRLRGQCMELPLSALSKEATGGLLIDRFGADEIDPGVSRVLHSRSNGNPLFMQAMIDYWLTQGIITREGGQWRLTDDVKSLNSTPDSLRKIVQEQVSKLHPADQDVLVASSAMGIEFSAAAIAAALERDEQKVESACAALARAGRFLRASGHAAWPDGTVAGRFAFSHDLYQAVLYDGTPPGQLAMLHRRIGQRLEVAYGGEASEHSAELARHFIAAHDAVAAVKYLKIAAEEALRRNGHQEAIAHVHTASTLLPGIADTRLRVKSELTLRAMLGSALVATRGWAEAEVEQALTRARELGVELADPITLSPVLYSLATLHELRGEYEKTQEVLEERACLPNEAKDIASQVETHELMACSTFHQGRFSEALEHARSGLELYDPGRHLALTAFLGENPGVSCHHWSALSLWFTGHPDEALQEIRRALRRAEDISHKFSLAHAQEQAACLHQHRREPAEVIRRAEATMTLAQEGGFPYRVATGSVLRGWALVAMGETSEGLPKIREGLSACKALGALIDYPYYLGLLADAEARAGRQREALQTVNEALACIEPGRGFFYEAELYRLRGSFLVAMDEDEADMSFRKALAIAQSQNAKSLELRAAISLVRLRRGRQGEEQAVRLLRKAVSWFSERTDTVDLSEGREVLAAA